MARLIYSGADPVASTDIANRLQANTILSSGVVNRISVASAIDDAAATYASKTYVDNQDATFALLSYYQAQDALNIANSKKGAANGVASLDGTGKVPLAQMPTLGAGYVLGPFGPTTVSGATMGSTPTKIADFDIGVCGLTFCPQVYAVVLATSANLGRTVVEARISDSQDIYDNQDLVSRGTGRDLFADLQPIPVTPCSSAGPYSPNMNVWVSLWVWDMIQSTVVAADGIVSASVYLMRTAQ